MFAVLSFDRAELEAFAKPELGLDRLARAADAVPIACLALAWEASRQRLKVAKEMDAQASSSQVPKQVPANKFLSLTSAFAEAYT